MPLQTLNIQGYTNIAKYVIIHCDAGYLEGIDFLIVPANSMTWDESAKEYGYVRFANQGTKNHPRYLQGNKIDSEIAFIKDSFFMPVRKLISVPIDFQFKKTDKIKLILNWTHSVKAAYFQLFLRWR